MKNKFKNSPIVLTAFILTQIGFILLSIYFKISIGVLAGGLAGITAGPIGVIIGEIIGALLDFFIST